MKKFKDLKVGDPLFAGSFVYRIYDITNDNGFIMINNNFFIPFNHSNSNMVKIGNKMLFTDAKQWKKYLHKEVDIRTDPWIKFNND